MYYYYYYYYFETKLSCILGFIESLNLWVINDHIESCMCKLTKYIYVIYPQWWIMNVKVILYRVNLEQIKINKIIRF
jgi:hypothetical protein